MMTVVVVVAMIVIIIFMIFIVIMGTMRHRQRHSILKPARRLLHNAKRKHRKIRYYCLLPLCIQEIM